MFIGGRVVIGGGGGMIKAVAVALLQEIAHPRLRPVTASVYYALYYSGSVMSAWVTFGTLHMNDTDWSWRLPFLLQMVGPILVIILTCTMPESPRWMVKNNKQDKALATLAKYHA
jgi:MFS family permease